MSLSEMKHARSPFHLEARSTGHRGGNPEADVEKSLILYGDESGSSRLKFSALTPQHGELIGRRTRHPS